MIVMSFQLNVSFFFVESISLSHHSIGSFEIYKFFDIFSNDFINALRLLGLDSIVSEKKVEVKWV